MPLETYSAVRLDLWWRVTPLLIGLGAGAGVAALLGRRLARRVAAFRVGRLGTAGTSELEFAIAFPAFLMCVLVTIQIALMINATLIVDYAAFCAARSAAVWVPQNLGGREPANTIEPHEDWSGSPDSQKWARVHGAATLAVIPISPRLSPVRFGLNIPNRRPPIDAKSLEEVARAADARVRGAYSLGQVALAVLDKWPYAYFFTNVDLLNAAGNVATTFQGTVTARVTHNFEMAVPFAGPLFGAWFGSRYIPLIGGYYVPISASYTLMLAQP